MASTFSPANLAFTYLQSGLCPPCHMPPVFAEVRVSILQILIEFSALGMQQEPGQSSHSQHPYLQRDHLDIKPSDLIPDSHLSPPLVLNALNHLLLHGTALWFSSHHYACLPASYSITSLVPVHGKCSQGLCLEPPWFLSPQHEMLFIPRFWIRNCKPTQQLGYWGMVVNVGISGWPRHEWGWSSRRDPCWVYTSGSFCAAL